ncbi:MAG TPA: M2 family metallopeptidase [Terriglobales bacterium]|nr:M2 family metallopeptidase [Terriglobales bacterium]
MRLELKSLLPLFLSIAVLAQTSSKKQSSTTDIQKFLDAAETRLNDLTVKGNRAGWVQETYITDDTEAISAAANENLLAAISELAAQAKQFEDRPMSAEQARKLKLLKLLAAAPAPSNPKERAELAQLGTWLDGTYGKGKYCPKTGPFAGQCLSQNEMERAFATTKDPNVLLDLWVGWHTISPPMRQKYARFVELANKGAREMRFADAGALWRSNYDMPPDQFSAELDRLWGQVRPLYLSLHAYVRSQLVKKYGPQLVPPNGPIPADLLGNIWAQDWTNIYDLLDVPGKVLDLTPILQEKKVDDLGMVRYGENFFKSLGFEPLPQTFWERSLFRKPADRDVICHASAWDIDNQDDLRLKMCIRIVDEDFRTIHHELGHNFYQRAYNHQPFLFEDSANDGFHEAIGDTIALSITPEYLKQINMLTEVPGPEGDLALLMHKALEKVAFLPFGLLIDEWRWGVFSGQIKPEDYNKAWWQLREKYQGVSAPAPRSENDFDPGAKFHVPGNTPYARYFLAHILQFQFQRGLCRAIGYNGPLHRCSIYNNKVAGERLNKMLAMGRRQPWPEELYALTGERQMDASAILDYFAPLQKWLDQQNNKNGVELGWQLQ